MELLCPDCLTPLDSADGQTARCSTHGTEFQILFARHFTPAVVEAPPVIPTGTCLRHPSVTVAYFCGKCGAGMCSACDIEQPDGTHLCFSCAPQNIIAPTPIETAPSLMEADLPGMPPPGLRLATSEPVAPPPLIPKVAIGMRCVQHVHLQAINQCKACGAFMCHTCTFDLPGNVTICPECATSPKVPYNANRKKNLIGSYVCAAWCTLMLVAISLGIFNGMRHDNASLMALNLIIAVTLVAPSLIGLGMGVSTIARRIPTPIAAWIAIVWNGLFVVRHILLVFLNLFS